MILGERPLPPSFLEIQIEKWGPSTISRRAFIKGWSGIGDDEGERRHVSLSQVSGCNSFWTIWISQP